LPTRRRRTLVNDWFIRGESPLARVTAFEAKTRFGELLDSVSKGEEVVITRHDKPVARLVPAGARRHDDVGRSVEGLRELQRRIRRRSKASIRRSPSCCSATKLMRELQEAAFALTMNAPCPHTEPTN
jgi:prevent-host-death family protein